MIKPEDIPDELVKNWLADAVGSSWKEFIARRLDDAIEAGVVNDRSLADVCIEALESSSSDAFQANRRTRIAERRLRAAVAKLSRERKKRIRAATRSRPPTASRNHPGSQTSLLIGRTPNRYLRISEAGMIGTYRSTIISRIRQAKKGGQVPLP